MNLVIADVAIRRDADGRYCLNDLHRAAGAEKRHGASYWLATQQTQEVIAEMETTEIPVVSVEGRKGGTFVAKELVYSYAMWISPVFSLRVIRAYDALVTGNIAEAERLSDRKASRNAARLEAPALTDAVRHMRKAEGKEIEHYHFVNEFDLINRIVLGMSAKQYRVAHGLSPEESVRDHLTTLEIKCVEHLQRANATMIDMGLRFDRRKIELHKIYIFRYAGALASEVQRLEA